MWIEKDGHEDQFPLGLVFSLVLLALSCFFYVSRVNAYDEKRIERCEKDPNCVNPFTLKGLGK